MFSRCLFCYEAGPTGYGLYRLIRFLGRERTVVATYGFPMKARGDARSRSRPSGSG